MVAPAAGAVVLVRFPFSDLSQTKVRPAVVLAQSDFVSGGLRITSHARPGKLFTANRDLIDSEAAVLTPQALTRIIDAPVRVLRSAEPR